MSKWKTMRKRSEIEHLGEVMIDLTEHFPQLQFDEELVSLLNCSEVPLGYKGNPYAVVGVVINDDGWKYLVCAFAVFGGELRLMNFDLTSERLFSVQGWIDDRLTVIREAEEKKEKVKELFKAHGLDDESIDQRREELLREHGLD